MPVCHYKTFKGVKVRNVEVLFYESAGRMHVRERAFGRMGLDTMMRGVMMAT